MTHKTHFDVYGYLADMNADSTCQNGRYAIQKDNEKNIPADVIKKLQITDQDTVLDIGCGLGLNTVALASIAAHVTAIDHPKVIEKNIQNIFHPNITFIGANFLDVALPQTYTKILAYSVLPALPNKQIVTDFVEKVLTCLSPAGIALLGDIANQDKKQRFVNSERGNLFSQEWKKQFENNNASEDLAAFTEDVQAVTFDDSYVIELLLYIRRKGYDAYLVNQPSNLPFGNTREDILIIGREYEQK